MPRARGRLRPKEVIATNSYEIMLLLSPDSEPERRAEIIERIKQAAETGKGSVSNVDEWGKKRLSYEINHTRDAHYFVITLTAPPETLDEIARVLKITDEVIRFMPVSLNEKVASES